MLTDRYDAACVVRKNVIFWVLMLALPLALAAIVLPPAWRAFETALRPEVIAWVATHLSNEERQQIKAQVSSVGSGMFQIIPDASVGRIARSHWRTVYKEADVETNNVGMRSRMPYLQKKEDTFRIICLGDSFVFGAGGEEEDRFCDQIQAFYAERNIRVNDKRIETLALGLPSWNSVQEAAYLAARLDEYAPDVVIMLTVQNDISDSAGVTENGELTTEYSIDHRNSGSAFFSNTAGITFGESKYTALTTDFCVTCKEYWQDAFEHVGRLVGLQHARQGKILLSVLNHPGKNKQLFVESFKRHAAPSGAPYTVTQYWHGPKTRLPHDGHPNRYGHYLLAIFYVHTLAELGWVSVPAKFLPHEVDMQPVNLSPPAAKNVDVSEKEFMENLPSAIDFTRLDEGMLGSLLGGFFPEDQGKITYGEAPWASIRAGFLLRKPDHAGEKELTLIVQLPVKKTLYPLPLTVKINGKVLKEEYFEFSAAGNAVKIVIPVPAAMLENYRVVEVLLETPRYFSGLEDQRMKSYQLLSAVIR